MNCLKTIKPAIGLRNWRCEQKIILKQSIRWVTLKTITDVLLMLLLLFLLLCCCPVATISIFNGGSRKKKAIFRSCWTQKNDFKEKMFHEFWRLRQRADDDDVEIAIFKVKCQLKVRLNKRFLAFYVSSFFKLAIPGLFLFIFVFSIKLTLNVQYKFCRWLDSNRWQLSYNHCLLFYHAMQFWKKYFKSWRQGMICHLCHFWTLVFIIIKGWLGQSFCAFLCF